MVPAARTPPSGRGTAIATLVVLGLAFLPALGTLAFTAFLLQERERLRWWMLPAPAWTLLAILVARGLLRVARGRAAEDEPPWTTFAWLLALPAFAFAAWILHGLMNLRIMM